MIIHIKLTEAIINQSLALHYSQKPSGKGLVRKLYLIPAFLIALAAYIIIDELRQPVIGFNFLMALLYIGFAVSYYFFMKKRLIKSGRRMLRELGEDANYEIEATDEKLVTKTTTQTFTHTWPAFTSALLANDNVLLYQLNNSFTMFNYSFFEPGDFEKFKMMVKENIKPYVLA